MTGHPDHHRAAPGNRITDVAGITVGHHHRLDAEVGVGGDGPDDPPGFGWATGTTVVRIAAPTLDGPAPTVAVDVRGGGPGTRETDLLDPSNTVTTAHAIVLSGGSAYGLATADGVMTELEAQGVGLPMDRHGHVVPIVPAAVIFDLPVGQWTRRPDADFGVHAVRSASADFEIGSVGAGTGARAAGLKGGLGTAGRLIDSGPAAGIRVGAVIAANPVGAVIDPDTGLPWGATAADLRRFGLVHPNADDLRDLSTIATKQTVLNTTIGVVATDAVLAPASVKRVAMAAHDGLARAIHPVHSPLDGDTIFAVATGAHAVEPSPQIPPGMNPEAVVLAEICRVAAEVAREAIVSAVVHARAVADIPAYTEVAPSVLG
ncbi:P1 family peptidase [Gordonia sp. NB41Y]|uniref:P1 family peptidase n=1 Tax=Gordonia sp. NB41Y TaxID=875808 RepID=UPI0006B1E956|nr:P1 family peptidase [Gordonia sp. NB41Y]EMP10299.2 hypothetical protein ISGA_5402 [Gordonia sp. NB41Y]WLP91380.1 P1 family peptidase [Gordonia sp. NB41Y]